MLIADRLNSYSSIEIIEEVDIALIAVNEKSRNPCNDQMIATAYAGAIQIAQEFGDYQDEATSLSSELILEAAICEIKDPKYDINSILKLVSTSRNGKELSMHSKEQKQPFQPPPSRGILRQ